MFRVDPIRGADLPRRAARPDPQQPAADAGQAARLPVPVDRVVRVAPRPGGPDSSAAFSAQLIGQDGQKRGLRAGAEVIDAAQGLYKRTEWSGSKDRRAAKGARARTEV